MKTTVLELQVNNHPGVMSHVCGLFARRAFNLEGILCLPDAGGRTSRIWLKVLDNDRLEQMLKQIRKLQDVLGVTRQSADHGVVQAMERYFTAP